jgi:hypothetical protein
MTRVLLKTSRSLPGLRSRADRQREGHALPLGRSALDYTGKSDIQGLQTHERKESRWRLDRSNGRWAISSAGKVVPKIAEAHGREHVSNQD